jgi:hypothetical protein
MIMNTFKKFIGTAVLMAGTALGSAAFADASSMTCGGFGAMNDAARLAYAHELLVWINDTANFETAGPALTGRYDKMAAEGTDMEADTLSGPADDVWTHGEMKIEIESHCINMPADSNIVERLQDHT